MKKEIKTTQENEIQTAIEKIRLYIDKRNIACSIGFFDNQLCIKFADRLTLEIIKQIKELVFFTNEIIITNIDSLFEGEDNCIKIYFTSGYEKFVKMYSALKEFKACVCMCEITSSCITFHYTLSHKHDLNYAELEILQNIINPEIKNHDSIRVSYLNGVSTLCADLSKLKEHLD